MSFESLLSVENIIYLYNFDQPAQARTQSEFLERLEQFQTQIRETMEEILDSYYNDCCCEYWFPKRWLYYCWMKWTVNKIIQNRCNEFRNKIQPPTTPQ
jgi:hypothetical protein